jgi:hypothetical protein
MASLLYKGTTILSSLIRQGLIISFDHDSLMLPAGWQTPLIRENRDGINLFSGSSSKTDRQLYDKCIATEMKNY